MTNPSILKALFLSCLLSIFVLSSSNATAADDDADQLIIADMLTQTEAPDGVVFELIGNESEYLLKAIKKIESYKSQLEKQFPDVEIAVVSHGSEQFNLTKDKQGEEKDTHKRVQRLVESDVPVHICAVHASWRDVAPQDFPDYITVSSTGPAEVRNYQALGYTLVVVD